MEILEDAPLEPVNFEETLSDYDNKIMKGVVHWNHPHFHSYFASGNDLSQILAESLSTCMSSLCSTWVSNGVLQKRFFELSLNTI